MSGHSKWATIRRKKAKIDDARGKTFSKIIKEITIAARIGGSDEMGNPRLRTAILAAKGANMPAANIERAVKKGTGELPGVTYEEITYEAYAPGGTALLIEVTTDNRNRAIGEIRHIVTKHGGNMAEAGAVGWMFSRTGVINVESEGVEEDALLMVALEAGAEDLKNEDDVFTVTTKPEDLETVREVLEKHNYKIESAEVALVPQNTVPVEEAHVKQLLKMLDLLEDNEDVLKVWSNFDIDEEILASIEE